MDRGAHRHPRAPRRRARAGHQRPGPRGVAARPRDGRPRRRRRRADRGRHGHPRLPVPERRRGAAGEARQQEGLRLRRLGRLRRLALRPLGGRSLRRDRRREERPGGRRRRAHRASPTGRTATPASSSATGPGAMVLEPGDDPRRGILTIRLHTDGSLAHILLQPGGGSRDPISARRWPRAIALRLHERPRGLQGGGPRAGGELPRGARRRGARPRRTSPTSSPTRPTSASSTPRWSGWRSRRRSAG